MFEHNINKSDSCKPTSPWTSAEYIPIEGISHFIPVGSRVVVKLDDNYRRIDAASISHSDNFVDGAHELSIEIRTALRGTGSDPLLDNMSLTGEYVVRLTDQFNRRTLFGTPQQPLRLSHSDNPSDNTTIIFSGKTTTPPLIDLD